MIRTSRLISITTALFALFTASLASAQESPCGKFDFTTGIDCRVEVKGGCEAQCTPLQFEAACSGGCTAMVETTCTNDCEVQCNAQCNPATLDCNAGCDAECESRCNSQCTLADCTDECQASCHSNCGASCTGTAADCQANCKECCHGACTTQANINCDINCYADLEGGCKVQCEEPSGALFCNGQYVSAADVNTCITYLQKNYNANVDVSARGEVTCDLNGCNSAGSSNVACSVASVGAVGASTGALAAAALAIGSVIGRRRRAAKK